MESNIYFCQTVCLIIKRSASLFFHIGQRESDQRDASGKASTQQNSIEVFMLTLHLKRHQRLWGFVHWGKFLRKCDFYYLTLLCCKLPEIDQSTVHLVDNR